MFFEGSEKKVEIVVDLNRSLRAYGQFWGKIVNRANATILSSISNDVCDAYLLSESSLFVFDDRIVMITCGTTSLVYAVLDIIEKVGLPSIKLLMYERKNEHTPDAQPTSFKEDVDMLREILPGETMIFGREDETRIFLFHYRGKYKPIKRDVTLEILMHGLSRARGELFFQTSRERLYRETGIHHIFDAFHCDDHLFEPMGYSLNAIRDAEYYTIHVTPEVGCSYASFETNHFFQDDLQQTVARVLDIFQPRNFTVVLFERCGLTLKHPNDYRLQRKKMIHSCGYRVHFHNFEQDLSKKWVS